MGFFTPQKKKPDPTDSDAIKGAAVKSFRDAMRAHDRALVNLSSSLKSFMNSLEELVSSLNNLAADSQSPPAIQLCGTLKRGLAEAIEGTAFDDLEDEIEHSIGRRFCGINELHSELDASRKRRSKAKRVLEDLEEAVASLEKKKDRSERDMVKYQEEQGVRYSQETEYRRLCSEFDDRYNDFVAQLGSAVSGDVTELTGVIHGVLSCVSYQFRKCHENIKLSGTPQKIAAA